MKTFDKLLTLSIAVGGLVFMTAACDKSFEAAVTENPVQPTEIRTRAEKAAVTVGNHDVTQRMAEIFISSNKENPPIVSVEPYDIDGVTCFYIIYFEKGFKVVSADTRIQPVLAESDRDSINPEKTDNKGVKVWLEDTADRIRVLKENNMDTGEDYSELWSAYRSPEKSEFTTIRRSEVDSVWVLMYETSTDTLYYNANVGPLLSTKWGQGSPWNSKMPTVGSYRCLTGCVAVATAQVLYFFNRRNMAPTDLWHSISIQNSTFCPTHGGLLVTLNKSNYTSNSILWSFMPLTGGGSNTDLVSSLMLDLGERLEMHYGLSGSGVVYANDGSIPHLDDCGISSYFGSYSFSNVEQSILEYKPVIVGATLNLTGEGGHVWVIDGCKDYSIKYASSQTYYRILPEELISYPNNFGVLTNDEMMSLYPDATGELYLLSHSVTYDNQESLHMNWGYDGTGDCWLNMLDSNDWIYSGSSGNSLIFLYNRVLHYNITTSQLN